MDEVTITNLSAIIFTLPLSWLSWRECIDSKNNWSYFWFYTVEHVVYGFLVIRWLLQEQNHRKCIYTRGSLNEVAHTYLLVHMWVGVFFQKMDPGASQQGIALAAVVLCCTCWVCWPRFSMLSWGKGSVFPLLHLVSLLFSCHSMAVQSCLTWQRQFILET